MKKEFYLWYMQDNIPMLYAKVIAKDASKTEEYRKLSLEGFEKYGISNTGKTLTVKQIVIL